MGDVHDKETIIHLMERLNKVTRNSFTVSKVLEDMEHEKHKVKSSGDIVSEWEKSFLWSERKRYDFYLPEYNTIIEIHGGHHYKESYKKDRSLRDVRTIDQRKYLLAKQNGLNYIEINVDKNSSEKIFEEINITLQDNLNIISVAEMATVLENSLIPIYCHIVKLLKQEKDVYYISKRLGRSVGSIQNYIRKAKSKRLVDK